jgi:hypothetical protein
MKGGKMMKGIGERREATPHLLALRKMLTPSDVAQLYGLSEGWLANLRSQRQGCKFYKIGAKVLYKAEDMERWVTSVPVLTKES